MDREAVIEFLGQVPLLQRLPSCSIHKLAELVQVKHYDHGDYVVREGETCDTLYFIWEGQAEVSGFTNGNEGNRSEMQLKKYDCFGYGSGVSVHQPSVIALSKLACLVLPAGYRNLLQPKLIWNADDSPEDFSPMECILRVEPLDVDLFRGVTLPEAPAFRGVYGGQLIGQALAAASKTVHSLKAAHSLHALFIIAGDRDSTIIYQVHHPRDGKSFATREVNAIQHGNVIFTLFASFQKEEGGFEHQESVMPQVPPPDSLLTMEELRQRNPEDPRLPLQYRNTVAKEKFVPWPMEVRFCETFQSPEQSHPSLKYWFKARGKLSDDPALHRCVVAYYSDFSFSSVSLNPHRRRSLETTLLSLDHCIWFHRPLRADDWLLFVIESPSANGGRGFCTGQIFNRKGELVVSLTQEALIRKLKPKNQNSNSKL